jgi:hypothetical protein
MPFSYTVPLSAFSDLYKATDPALHPELTERLRIEIHADLARRVSGQSLMTAMGPSSTSFDSVGTSDEIVFYGDELTGPRTRLTAAPRQGAEMASGLGANTSWRYPGDAGNGLFAASVNSVMAKSGSLKTAFLKKSSKLSARRGR